MHELRSHGRLTLLSLATFALVAGCGGAGGEADTTSTGPATAPVPEGAVVPPPPIVALVAPGSGERRVLRFDYRDGSAAHMGMEMDMTVASRQGDAAPAAPVSLPTMIFEATAGPYRRYPDGTTAYPYGYDSVRLVAAPGTPQEGMAAVMEPMLSPMTRIRGESAFTDRGQVTYVYNDIPADLDPQVAQSVKNAVKSMTQIVPMLPDEAVGVGARWTTTSPVESDAFRFEQTSTYTLAAMEGDRITLEIAIAQSAPLPQEVPSGTPGVKVTLVGFSGSGTATTTLSLRELELRSEMSYLIHIENVAEAPGQRVPVTVDMTMAIRAVTTPLEER